MKVVVAQTDAQRQQKRRDKRKQKAIADRAKSRLSSQKSRTKQKKKMEAMEASLNNNAAAGVSQQHHNTSFAPGPDGTRDAILAVVPCLADKMTSFGKDLGKQISEKLVDFEQKPSQSESKEENSTSSASPLLSTTTTTTTQTTSTSSTTAEVTPLRPFESVADKKAAGAKRNHDAIAEEELQEESLSIKSPPPVKRTKFTGDVNNFCETLALDDKSDTTRTHGRNAQVARRFPSVLKKSGGSSSAGSSGGSSTHGQLHFSPIVKARTVPRYNSGKVVTLLDTNPLHEYTKNLLAEKPSSPSLKEQLAAATDVQTAKSIGMQALVHQEEKKLLPAIRRINFDKKDLKRVSDECSFWRTQAQQQHGEVSVKNLESLRNDRDFWRKVALQEHKDLAVEQCRTRQEGIKTASTLDHVRKDLDRVRGERNQWHKKAKQQEKEAAFWREKAERLAAEMRCEDAERPPSPLL